MIDIHFAAYECKDPRSLTLFIIKYFHRVLNDTYRDQGKQAVNSVRNCREIDRKIERKRERDRD